MNILQNNNKKRSVQAMVKDHRRTAKILGEILIEQMIDEKMNENRALSAAISAAIDSEMELAAYLENLLNAANQAETVQP